MAFRSEIIFHIPSPVNNNPNIMLRAIPPKPSEERLPSKIIIISPIIIIPPLTISNMDIVFEGTFLLQ